MDINPRLFAKSNSNDESQLLTNREEFANDDDDPLSIKDASITFIGIILAFMTMFLPAISVFFERPFLLRNGVINNESVKKDGY